MFTMASSRDGAEPPVSSVLRSRARPRQSAVAAVTLGFLLLMAVACGNIPFIGGDDAVAVVEADSAYEGALFGPREPVKQQGEPSQDQSDKPAVKDAGADELGGPPGPPGPPGERGESGTVGPAGPPGEQGLAGASGASGANGTQGVTGDTGATGLKGPSGPAGVTGTAGPAGVSGPTGELGPPGDIGPVGPDGLPGGKGEQGLTGEQGLQGPAGPQGIAGASGASGEQGPQGQQGPRGDPGGPIGPAGPQGPTGPAGATGSAGAVGPKGPQGPSGVFANYTIVSITVGGANPTKFIDLPCPTGLIVIGGGYAATRDDVSVPLSLPVSGGTGWRVKAVGPVSPSWEVNVYAICAK